MKICGFSEGTWENKLRKLLNKACLLKLAKMPRDCLKLLAQRLSIPGFKDNIPKN